jgi:hypothetical protein
MIWPMRKSSKQLPGFVFDIGFPGVDARQRFGAPLHIAASPPGKAADRGRGSFTRA